MNKEQKQKLINEIVGILHKDAGTMYDGAPPDYEARIALDEDYFGDVAESTFNYLENIFSQKHRKESSGLEFENVRLNAKLELFSEAIERCDALQEDRDRYKAKYEDLIIALKTPAKVPMSNIRQKVDKWWRELPHYLRVKYATQHLDKKGMIFKYNNDGYIIGIHLNDIEEMYNLHLENYKIEIAINQINVKTSNDLFELLVYNGGQIVSSNYLPTWEIQQAQASNRMFVDENGLGFVWIPTFKNPFPETVEEVKMFEMCYPLDVEKPLKIKLSKILNWK